MIRTLTSERQRPAVSTDPTNGPGPASPARATAGLIVAVAALVFVVVGIIAVAFRGSWGALRDAALAAHFDGPSADLYPFAVDGLLVVAILAAVLLRHDRGARRYTLGIIAGYTGASWVINFLHGLGMFSPDPVTHVRPGAPWYVVLVIASLVIGSIFLGSHLLVYVWRHMFPTAVHAEVPAEVFQPGTPADRGGPPVPEPPANNVEAAKLAYRHSLTPGMARLSQKALVDQFGLTKRQAGAVQSEVAHDLAGETVAAAAPEPDDEPVLYGVNGQFPGSASPVAGGTTG